MPYFLRRYAEHHLHSFVAVHSSHLAAFVAPLGISGRERGFVCGLLVSVFPKVGGIEAVTVFSRFGWAAVGGLVRLWLPLCDQISDIRIFRRCSSVGRSIVFSSLRAPAFGQKEEESRYPRAWLCSFILLAGVASIPVYGRAAMKRGLMGVSYGDRPRKSNFMSPSQIHALLSTKQPLKLRCIGGRSYFSFFYTGGALFVISSKGVISKIDNALFSAVAARYSQLTPAQRKITTAFGNRWPGCPNPRLGPWVGRIVDYFQTGI